MAKQVELQVVPREVQGKATKRLRAKGIIPANLCGHKQISRPIQFDEVQFERLRKKHGTKSIYALRLPDGKVQTALIKEVQYDPVSSHLLHVEFSRVDMEEMISVKIPLHFVGESPAVKNLKAVPLHLVDELSVKCRATDIVPAIDVDISVLENIDDVIYAKDIKLPQGIELEIDPEEPIAKAAAPKVELPEIEPESTEAASPTPVSEETGEAS
ncbi:large subunit ribosomal protein L25 [Thermosporothrix hazakensis]|jgi:large subunit ribosomal protein L25|uniref:Large ribosomal subunit protein bL25 n=1 Tax=Thermosporothrix hazakensis TaxID=644383 RepID=A0A326TT08_THEHA|nr:50S ribosomal protein L25 [Thermosporothrix hazakensis]PZW18341.1 large subunit ribosomal protein L25 [Thermosporothrix hazakensis]GCE48416.1 50S ribosomal protein L25 [Thermosporothrix hazakensis]